MVIVPFELHVEGVVTAVAPNTGGGLCALAGIAPSKQSKQTQ
jgi:hypothetical protein